MNTSNLVQDDRSDLTGVRLHCNLGPTTYLWSRLCGVGVPTVVPLGEPRSRKIARRKKYKPIWRKDSCSLSILGLAVQLFKRGRRGPKLTDFRRLPQEIWIFWRGNFAFSRRGLPLTYSSYKISTCAPQLATLLAGNPVAVAPPAMAQVILSITLALTVARTLFVVDAIQTIAGHTSVVSRTAHAANMTIFSARPSQAPSAASPRSPRVMAAGTGSSKVRSLHLRLVAIHVAAIVGQFAGVLQYTLPVTESNCAVTNQVKAAFTLLTDMAIVLFLLAKVKVTNGRRKLAIWETGILWLSRAYAWVYSPFIAVAVSVTYPSGTNEEGTYCYNSLNSIEGEDTGATDSAIGYATSNAALMVQFVLLLVLFVRPLLVPVQGTQSGGASYRRVVIKNVVCTVSMVVAYLITTIVTTRAMLNETPDDYTNSQVADTAPMVNQLVTLCLTEIALPLGFSSCWKTCSSVYRALYPAVEGPRADKVETGNGACTAATFTTNATGNATGNATATATITKIVPVVSDPS